MPQTLKIAVLGDVKSGKTCLLLSFFNGQMPQGYLPTVYDHYKHDVNQDGITVSLNLWDTSGKADYDSVRPLCFEGAHAVMLCFSVVNRASFTNLRMKWAPMVKHYAPRAGIVVVGCKADLRDDAKAIAVLQKKGESVVSNDEGHALAREIGATRYTECSLKNVINDACAVGTQQKKNSSVCTIL